MKTCGKCREDCSKHRVHRVSLEDVEFSSDSYLKSGLGSNFGICDVRLDYFDGFVCITYNPSIITLEEVKQALKAPGFVLAQSDFQRLRYLVFCHANVMRLAIVGLLVVVSWAMRFRFGTDYRVPNMSHDYGTTICFSYMLINLGAVLLAVWPRFRGAFEAVVNRHFKIDILILIAIAGALLTGYWLEAATFSLVAVFVDAFDEIIAGQTWREYLNGTVANAKNAYIVEGNVSRKIPIHKLKVGQSVLVKQGMLIPVDGCIVRGSGRIDESSITGENTSFSKTIGDRVFAGTLLESGSLTIEAIHIGHDTAIGAIAGLINNVQHEKESEIKKVVDSCAAWLAMLTLAYSAIFFTISYFFFHTSLTVALTHCISIIFVSCPCALLLSAPLAIHAGVGMAARFGIIFRNGQVLEDFAKTKVLLVDKTGTLTYARSVVSDVRAFNFSKLGEVLRIGLALEQNSCHPLALAICSYAQERNISAPLCEQFEELEGGTGAKINGGQYYIGARVMLARLGYRITPEIRQWLNESEHRGGESVLVADSRKIIGGFRLMDQLREESPEVIRQLRELGMKQLIMLTGDNQSCARHIAEQLELDDYQAECFPETKLRRLQEIKQYQNVAMIGDGINDAPAMAAATVGIVLVSTGTDAAITAADIALAGNNLNELVVSYDISRKVYRTIKGNVLLSVLLVLIMLGMVSTEQLTLTQSTLLYLASSLLVIISSYAGLLLTMPWLCRLMRRPVQNRIAG